MDYDRPNVYLTLQGLIQLGMVTRDSAVRPHRYRLASPLAYAEAKEGGHQHRDSTCTQF